MWVTYSDRDYQRGPECTRNATLYSIPGGASMDQKFRLQGKLTPTPPNISTARSGMLISAADDRVHQTG